MFENFRQSKVPNSYYWFWEFKQNHYSTIRANLDKNLKKITKTILGYAKIF